MYERICPEEEVLSAYIHDCLPAGERGCVEAHLAGCSSCRELVADALRFGRQPRIAGICRTTGSLFKRNLPLAGAVLSLCFSFLCPRYFMQFLAAAIIMGFKWAAESNSFRMMFLIQERFRKETGKKADGSPLRGRSSQNNR